MKREERERNCEPFTIFSSSQLSTRLFSSRNRDRAHVEGELGDAHDGGDHHDGGINALRGLSVAVQLAC